MKTAIIAVVLMAIVSVSAFKDRSLSASALRGRSLGEASGISNCYNKCDKVFDRLQYSISDQPNQDTFEFRSCILGCNRCSAQLNNPNTKEDKCFDYCKTVDYGAMNIRKGVIEPDKACVMGCVINTCQKICFGGTTEWVMTPQNAQFFWNGGGHGCSIKGMLGYVQHPDYVNPDAPVGATASVGQRQCCSNAFNLCNYTPSANDAANFANVVLVAQRSCRRFVTSTDTQAICAWQATPRNCGNVGMPL